MKILLVSDSHRDLEFFEKVIKKEKPDSIIFAGDHSIDAIDMSYIFDNIPFYIVRGNCDYMDSKTVDIMQFELAGKNILLTHGHLFGVKSTMNEIYKLGVEKGADMVIFGHTHRQHQSMFKDVLFINPGAITNHQYAVYEDGELRFK